MAIIYITMLSNPAAFFGAMLPIKPHIITMLALGESYAGHFVCKWGGLRPLQPPPLFKGHGCLQKNKTRVRSSPASMHAKNKHQVVAVWIIHVCTRGKLRGSFCLQMGGAAPPPNPPPLFKGHGCLQKNKTRVRSSPASMHAKNKHQVVAMWIIHVLHLGKATRVILFANGGGCTSPNPPLLKAVDANCLIFIIFIVFRDLSLVFIIPCFCIILEPS